MTILSARDARIAKLEADMVVLAGLLETARDYVGDIAQGRAHELAKAAIVEMAQDDLNRIDETLTRIQGGYRSGEATPSCDCGKPATTKYDGDEMCEPCARYCAIRDFEEGDMPGGFGE